MRAVVAHLSGTCADVLAGNLAGVATDAWTEAQVRARRSLTLGQLIEEWSGLAPQVEAFSDYFPGRTGEQWVADLTTHEHDIRTAVSSPGARQSDGVLIGVEFLIVDGLHSTVSARGLAPLEVRAGDRSWIVGTGEAPAEESDATGPQGAERPYFVAFSADGLPPGVEATGRLEASAFELFRALTGRRSQAQICHFDWSVDPRPYVPAFQFGPFTTSPIDINE